MWSFWECYLKTARTLWHQYEFKNQNAQPANNLKAPHFLDDSDTEHGKKRRKSFLIEDDVPNCSLSQYCRL